MCDSSVENHEHMRQFKLGNDRLGLVNMGSDRFG